jgi:hypothetical protein
MVAREQLERDQRRSATRRALVFEPAPEELGLLPEAKLPDRAVRDRTLAVVGRAGRVLDLVLPLRAKARELLLASLLGQGGGFRSR